MTATPEIIPQLAPHGYAPARLNKPGGAGKLGSDKKKVMSDE
jgi:hypothetical protein